MPARDAKGKPLSGAAKRKAARARAADYTQRQATTVTAPAAAPSDFAQLRDAPIGQPAEAITWANDVLLITLQQVVRDPALHPLIRWRWIKELAAVLGMLRDKSAEQKRLQQLYDKLNGSGSKPRGAKAVAGIQKPDTARRA